MPRHCDLRTSCVLQQAGGQLETRPGAETEGTLAAAPRRLTSGGAFSDLPSLTQVLGLSR